MSDLLINSLQLPEDVRKRLLVLSESIEIKSYDTKATNGYVFFGANKILGTPIAIKFYYWGGKSEFHAEPKSLVALHSANVMTVQDAGYAGSEWAYFVSPLYGGGDLDTYLSGEDHRMKEAVGIGIGLLAGLSHLHQSRLLHRDIKPANVFLQEKNVPVIGDFGSLKYLPATMAHIPASSHSVLYRPPESFGHTGTFGFSGDIYQVGLVLFQLLGGPLPYDELAWLSDKQKQQVEVIDNDADRSIFIDNCIEARCKKGQIADLTKLPAWTAACLKRVVRRATHPDPSKRFSSVAPFINALTNCWEALQDWELSSGKLLLHGPTTYKLDEQNGVLRVQKRRSGAEWRNDNSFGANPKLDDIVAKLAPNT